MLDVVRRLGNAEASRCTLEQFDSLYKRSIEDSDGFWLEQAKRLDCPGRENGLTTRWRSPGSPMGN